MTLMLHADVSDINYFSLHGQRPMMAQIELTYRCQFNCVHCYCKGSEFLQPELSTRQWCALLDMLADKGCLVLTITGGEPLLREDFFEIYLHAKKRGFIIILFTNGGLLSDEHLLFFKEFRPHAIEITVNGMTEGIFDRITRTDGSYDAVMGVVNKAVTHKLPLCIKANGMTLNKDELARIKQWAEHLFPRKQTGRRYRFKVDMMLYPRLNGDTAPLQYRLSAEEIRAITTRDLDLRDEHRRSLLNQCQYACLSGDRLYPCTSWTTSFFITPYGRLKFCQFIDDYSTDLLTDSFDHGFYEVFSHISQAKGDVRHECVNCTARSFCMICPGRAYLETGSYQAVIPYFCSRAFALKKQHDELVHQYGYNNA